MFTRTRVAAAGSALALVVGLLTSPSTAQAAPPAQDAARNATTTAATSTPTNATEHQPAGARAVRSGDARFEVLSPTLIRMEYSGDGHFTDAATINAVGRDTFRPALFRSVTTDGWLTIDTGQATLRYKVGSGPFTATNLLLRLRTGDQTVTAHPTFPSTPRCVAGALCEAESADLTGGVSVASNHTGFTGTGFAAGFTASGSTLTYLLDVPTAGTYELRVRYANALGGDGQDTTRTLSESIDSGPAATITMPTTPSWDDWAIATVPPVPLTAGAHTLTITRAAHDSGNVNIDSLALTAPGAAYPTPAASTAPCPYDTVCQAEAGRLSGGADLASNHNGYAGPGFVAGLEQSGAADTISVTGVPTSGTYQLQVRYANALSAGQTAPLGRTASVTVDGGTSATLRLPPTADWDTWSTVTVPVTLAAGTNTVAIGCPTADSCHVNLDTVALTTADSPILFSHSPLGGWRRSLDGESGAAITSPGLLYRDGWSLIDDSSTALWTSDGWAQPRPSHGGKPYQDGYVFAYGQNYAAALEDFVTLTGRSPLLPEGQFGFQYSRYFPYSTADYEKNLIPMFREQHVPLDVLYIDTDWKAPASWNGWNWNTALFPDPAKFLAWAHSQGLEVALNIHPSIQTTDPKFAQTQKIAGGLTPSGGGTYVWDWSNQANAQSYLDLHQPFEKQGVDFWWLDWCCDASYVSMPGVTPDTWINYLYARDLTSKGKRGFVFSRMGSALQSYTGSPNYPSGPWAAHRYDVHFTGDTFSTRDMLAFEASFTADEGASIALPYVGDDLGGFHAIHDPDDLYARWMQLGTFQPIDRVHSSHGDRLPWKYGPAAEASAERFIRLREALVPYTYTAARVAHDSGMPIVRALYLAYPNSPQAYTHHDEYLYGSQMLVAPITAPGDPASRQVWFPKGSWVDYFTGARYAGPSVQTVTVPLGRMPAFVKSGGIVPEQPAMEHVGAKPDAPTTVKVYTGGDGTYRLYRDAGKGLGYQDGQYSWTAIDHVQHGNGQQVIRIGAAEGRYPGQPAGRQFQVQLVDATPPARVTANSQVLQRVSQGSNGVGWWFDPAAHTVHVTVPAMPVGRAVTVALDGTHVVDPPQEPAVGVTVQVPTFTSGQASAVTATVTNHGPGAVSQVSTALAAPAGWTVTPDNASGEAPTESSAPPPAPSPAQSLAAGASETVTWHVTPAQSSTPLGTARLTATASYDYGQGSLEEQGSARGSETAYVQDPVSAPYKTFASTRPAFFGQSGGRLAIATDGSDLWKTNDDFAAIYRQASAGQHSTVTVRVDAQQDTNAWAKSGIMLRDNITGPGSTGFVVIAVTPGHGVQMAWDADGNGQLESDAQAGAGTVTAPVWLRLSRDGSTFTGYYSSDGKTWNRVGVAAGVPGSGGAEDAGVFTLSHADGVVGQADFSDVTVTSG